MTHQELFDATVTAYLLDRLAFGFNVQRDRCEYRTPDGAKCAIGRHLTDVDIEEMAAFNGGLNNLLQAGVFTLYETVPDVIERRFEGCDPDFLSDIQRAHDLSATNSAPGDRSYMYTKMELVARDHGLETTVLDAARAVNGGL